MNFEDIKSAHQLKVFCDNNPSNGCPFFNDEEMEFSGDTMQNFSIKHHRNDEVGHYVELKRKKAVRHGLKKSNYFKLMQNTNYCVKIFV